MSSTFPTSLYETLTVFKFRSEDVDAFPLFHDTGCQEHNENWNQVWRHSSILTEILFQAY